MVNKAIHAHGGGSGWHQACIQYLDLSAAAVIAKSPLHYFLLFSVTADCKKLYFQPTSESPKTVSLIKLY